MAKNIIQKLLEKQEEEKKKQPVFPFKIGDKVRLKYSDRVYTVSGFGVHKAPNFDDEIWATLLAQNGDEVVWPCTVLELENNS